ncbi:MAG: T9SS type A sorting domain-containing protein [Saprospiraceae bacterium]|nr:T9SS type A sorting domain-containing protein [Saprospiraceae bacterium]
MLFIRTGADGCIIPNECNEVSVLTETTIPDYIEDIIISPNPASVYVTVQSTEPVTAAIISMTGRRLTQSVVFDSRQTIDVSGLPSGLYFIKTRTKAGKERVSKIIKQ